MNCDHVYITETGRPLGAQVKEHCKKVEKITGAYTRAEKTTAGSISNKSAITDYVCYGNHVIDWESVKATDQEADNNNNNKQIHTAS